MQYVICLVGIMVGKAAGATAISGSPTITRERTEYPSALELMARFCTVHLPIWCQFLHPSAKRLQGAELRATIQMIPNPLTKG